MAEPTLPIPMDESSAGTSLTRQNGPHASFDRLEAVMRGAGLSIADHRRDEFMAGCPVHEDRNPSVHVTWDKSGKTFIHCFANCRTEDILAALGLSMSDLFDEPLPPSERRARVGRGQAQRKAGTRRGKLGPLPKRLLVETGPEPDHEWVETRRYRYVDLDGRPVQVVIRQECTAEGKPHKRFAQRFLTRDGREVTRKPAGFKPVLFRAPQVRQAALAGGKIYLLEGEKDVETAERLGEVATTNTQGGASFPDDLVGEFAGAHVVVVLDRDGTGWARGVALHRKLSGVAASVQLALSATEVPKSDLTDHVDAGFALDDLIEVTVDQVAAWAEQAKIEGQHRLVVRAEAEARARMERAAVDEDGGVELRYARRWTLETQIRIEQMTDLLGDVRRLAEAADTQWSHEAASEGERVVEDAVRLARRLHEDIQEPIPELLIRKPTPQAVPDAAQVETAAAPAATSDENTTVSAETGDVWPSVHTAEPVSDEQELSVSGALTEAPVFRVQDGKIWKWEPSKDKRHRDDEDEASGGVLKQLLSMVVRVVAREFLEDETDEDVEQIPLMGRSSTDSKKASSPRSLVAVRVEYTDPVSGELMQIRVAADQWNDHSWLASLPAGTDYGHKRAELDVLQRAILAVSKDVVVDEVLHRSIGWRQNPDGTHKYIHARGAITRDGHEPTEVALSGPITRFDLPDPTRDAAVLREAWLGCSAVMLEMFPGRLTAPLLGQTFRAVLGPNPWNVALIGSPGSFKTSLASKTMHHFGEKWEHTSPLTSMSGNGATLNALRLTLNKAKDGLAWLDDFAPTKSWLDAQKLLEETSRLIHNREARPRSSRDGQEVLAGTAPRASGLFTSEVMPRPGSSGGERMLVVPMQRDEITLADLKKLDVPASRHGRALVMASFISWLAGELTARRDKYMGIAADYAEMLADQEGESVRQAAAISHTWIGWVAMLDFLQEIGAISDEERTLTLERVDVHLREAGRAAVDPDIPRTTGARVKELLGYALRQGIAYVDDVRTGDDPPWPLASRLGWRRTNTTGGDDPSMVRYRMDRSGLRLGYVLHDPRLPKETRGRVLMCVPSQIEAAIKSAGSSQVEKLEIDWKTAARALYDEGVLLGDATSEPGRVRMTLKCRLQCEDDRNARMAVLRLDDVIGTDEPDDEPDINEGTPGNNSGPDDGDSPAPEPQPIPGLFDDTGAQGLDNDDTMGQSQDRAADHRENLGPDQPAEENLMSDLRIIDNGATGECVECSNPTRTALGDQPVHGACYQRLLGLGLPGATPATPTAAPEPVAPAEPATPVQEKPRTTVTKQSARPAASTREFRATAMVLDTSGMFLSNGEELSLPTQKAPTNLAQLAILAQQYQLGTRTSKYRTAAGQVWITEAMARHIGFDVDAIQAADDWDEAAREITAGHSAVEAAKEAGWQLGGKGPGLGKWTRIWNAAEKTQAIFLVLMPSIDPEKEGSGLLDGDPTPASLARRIGLFADAYHQPYHVGAAITGEDLLKDLRGRDFDRFFEVREPVAPAAIGNVAVDPNWCRTPSGEEAEHKFVHAYDRSGSYLAGSSGLKLGFGEPVHYPNGIEFQKGLQGYYRIEVPENGDWRMPNPLDLHGRDAGKARWRESQTLQLALELEYAPKILEAWIWPNSTTILDPFYATMRDGRTKLDSFDAALGRETDPDMKAARDQGKLIYALLYGMFGSAQNRQGTWGHQPHLRHGIVAKSGMNVLRLVHKTGLETGRWPVAIYTDTVVYTSNEADPVKAWPGREKKYGRGLGQYKHEGTALLADHMQYLTGGRYTGREILIAGGEQA